MAAPDASALDRITGNLGGALLALDFVTEPETWPVFAAWVARLSPPDSPGVGLAEEHRLAMIRTMAYLDQVFKVAQAAARGR